MQTGLRRQVATTERYHDLQGLRLVVGGVGLLAFSAWTIFFPSTLEHPRLSGAGYALNLWGLGLLLSLLVVIVLSARAVSGWYDRNYGHVTYTRRQRRAAMLIGGLGVGVFLVSFEVETSAFNAHSTLPINVIGLSLSCWTAGYWFYMGGRHHHYLAISCIGFIVTLASVAGLPPNGFLWHLRVATAFFGAASIAGGLIDHRILTHALGSSNSVGVDT